MAENRLAVNQTYLVAEIAFHLLPLGVVVGSERIGLTITKELATHATGHQHHKTDPRKSNLPIEPSDLDMVPTLWRDPDSIEPGNDETSLLFKIDMFDGSTMNMPVIRAGNTLIAGSLWKEKKKKSHEKSWSRCSSIMTLIRRHPPTKTSLVAICNLSNSS